MIAREIKTGHTHFFEFVNEKAVPLRKLLDDCCSPNREFAWAIFVKRYLGSIREKVANRCAKWNIPRLQRQFSEVVDDIVAEVLLNLCKNDSLALQNFRERDSEPALLSWLTMVCKRACDNFIMKQFKKTMIEEKTPEEIRAVISMESDTSWELYELVVQTLRSACSKKRRFRERDIHIFLLYIWAGFSSEMIQFLFAKGIGRRVVDVVVNRMRNELRTNPAF